MRYGAVQLLLLLLLQLLLLVPMPAGLPLPHSLSRVLTYDRNASDNGSQDAIVNIPNGMSNNP